MSGTTLQHGSGRGRDENEPLLYHHSPPDGSDDGQDGSKSFWYMVILTISLGGLQLAWSVELSNGSPYLLSLGVSKSLMALVWIAGPLTGTLVQPYVGMLSDNCRISWGKRKPFIFGGAVATTCSLLFLSWTTEIVGGLLRLLGTDPQSEGAKIAIIVVAVIWVYVLDFSINTVQAAIRAFIVDCAPPHQQEAANAMASRIVGVGNIVGYCAGYVNLPKYVPWLGHTQFQGLCSVASIGLCSTVLLSTMLIPERDPNLDGPPPTKEKFGLIDFFITILGAMKRLPPQIKKVCTVQFCAWVGFFPMLFYTSSYIGGIYIEPFLEENPHMTPSELDKLYEQATRVGTYALLIFAVTSLAANVFLPFLIAPTYDNSPGTENASAGVLGAAESDEPDRKTLLDYLVIPGFTLRRAWMISHIIFAFSMFSTLLVRTVEAATALIGVVGITWALTLWAPWAIISGEISRRDAMIRTRKQTARSSGRDFDSDSDTEQILDQERRLQDGNEEVDKAGVILGIHNMAIAAPQILATLGSSIIFRFTQKPRGVPGDRSFAIVLALGGIFVLGASYFVHLIKDDVAPEPLVTAEEGDRPPTPAARPAMTRTQSQRRATLARTKSQRRATLARNKSYGGLEY